MTAKSSKQAAPKTASKRAATKPAPQKKAEPKPTKKAGAEATAPSKALSGREAKDFRSMLLAARERLSGQVAALQSDSLTREDAVNSEEDGTDAFERQFALNLAWTENVSILEIDEALRRLDEGNYGVCEDCNSVINKERLKALPFVRLCIDCKSKQESGRNLHSTILRRRFE